MTTVETPPRTPKSYLTLSARPERVQDTDITRTVRQRVKCLIQTRMLMVRYSVALTESENRFAWGDR